MLEIMVIFIQKENICKYKGYCREVLYLYKLGLFLGLFIIEDKDRVINKVKDKKLE